MTPEDTLGGLVRLPESDEVHVWRASLDQPRPCIEAFLASLSDDERKRAERFRLCVDRDRFVAGRGIQREILSRYLGIPARALTFRAATNGKPMLDLHTGPDVRFNVSNSGDLALYAVAVGRELGVDLELVHPIPEVVEIAAQFFSRPENAKLLALPESERDIAFFRCWTRKEAYVKALGEGLSLPLDQFDVTFAPGEVARILETRGDLSAAGRWTMHALRPGNGYVGAVVVEGNACAVSLFDWIADS